MGDLYEEMQKIFSNCSTENDKIRSSVFIEVVAVNYGLNEDLKGKLVNKLDPDHNDFMYTKDELFIIFKDWISSEPSADKSPLFVPLTFACPDISHASTPVLPLELMRRRLPRTRLFMQDSHYGSDDVDLDVSHSSSSTKRRLSHHKSILESKLENSERHASSLEKRYEDANSICALQKIEIERLKMELRNYHEVEQSMDEISEEKRKIELESEKKCAKLQADLSSAYTRIEDFELMIANLKQELSQAVENCQHWENEAKLEKERFLKLQNDFTEKELHYEESIIKLHSMKQQITDNDHTLSKLLEEKSALTSEINVLKNILSEYEYPRTYCSGIPLCEELPSEMLQFPVNEDFSPDETTLTSSSNSSRLKTSYCQTEMKTYFSLTNVSTQCSLESLYSDDNKKTAFCQTEDILTLSTVDNFSQVENETLENFSQTNHNETQSNLTQTELLYNLFSVCCQTDIHKLHSICSQTEHFEMQPNFSQTEIFELQSTYSQTEHFEVQPSFSQTEIFELQSTCSQTEQFEMLPNFSQTEIFESQSTCSQTELVTLHYNYTQTREVFIENSSQTESYEVHMNSTQTECVVESKPVSSQTVDMFENLTQNHVATIDSPSQTEIVLLNTSSTQTSGPKDVSLQTLVCESASSFSQTVWSSIFCQTEPCNDHLPCMMQTPIQELIHRSSQVGACISTSNTLQDQRIGILLLRVVVKMISCLVSLFSPTNTIGRFLYSSVKQIVTSALITLGVSVIAFFVFFFVCQDNRCVPQLRYPRGPPPV